MTRRGSEITTGNAALFDREPDHRKGAKHAKSKKQRPKVSCKARALPPFQYQIASTSPAPLEYMESICGNGYLFPPGFSCPDCRWHARAAGLCRQSKIVLKLKE